MIRFVSDQTIVLSQGWIPYVMAAVAGVFGGGGIAAFINVRKTGTKIIVDAAEGAVIVQSGVIKDLTGQVERQRGRIEHLEQDNASLKAQVAELQQQIVVLQNGGPH